MRKKLTRTLVVTTVQASRVTVKEVAHVDVLEPITVFGKVNPKNAIKEVQALYDGDNFVITSITTDEKAYEMDLDLFIKHATEITLEQARSNNQ